MTQQQTGFLTTRRETLPGPKGGVWSHSPHGVRFPSKGAWKPSAQLTRKRGEKRTGRQSSNQQPNSNGNYSSHTRACTHRSSQTKGGGVRAPRAPARSKLGKDDDNCHRLCDKGSLNHFSPGNSHLAYSPSHSQVLDLKGEVRK